MAGAQLGVPPRPEAEEVWYLFDALGLALDEDV
jgi:hypothetical protein